MDNTDFIPQVGMEVFGSDGEKIGKIDAVEANHFVVSKGFLFPEDHYIPLTAVNNYDGDNVYLNVTKDGALEQNWGQQPVDDNVEPLDVAATGAGDMQFAETGRTDDVQTDLDRGQFAREEADTLEVREEELHAGKREVDRGTVRVDKHVVEEQQSIDVPLREEEVHVERRAVNRPADSADFEEATIEVPVRGEEAEVSRTARVVEEIDVDKTAHERVETVTGSVRHEEVDIDADGVHGGLDREHDDRSLVDKAKDAVDPDDDGIR